MTDLAAFLAARLDEDERYAVAAAARAPGPWVGAFRQVTAEPPGRIIVVAAAESADVSHHIERNEPARVLREVAAGRAILALHKPEFIEVINADQDERAGWVCTECDFCDYPCPTLRHLAAVYSDHPDYRDEWKP